MARRTRAATTRQRLAQRHVRPTPPGDRRLSLVVPAFREEAHIRSAVERIHAELGPLVGEGELEVVVVDDGSGDATAARARAAGAEVVVTLPRNRGKGAAVRAGVAQARGRTVAFTDADLSYAPAQVHRLLEQVEDGWDVVVGSRHHRDTATVVEPTRVRALGGRAINAATRLVLVGEHDDTQCGLKAFRSDVAAILFGRARVDGFAFDVELFALAEHLGFSVTAVPVEVANSDRSTVHVVRDAARLLVDLGRIRRAAGAGAYDLRPGELAPLSPGADAGPD